MLLQRDHHQKSQCKYFHTCLRPVWSHPPSPHLPTLSLPRALQRGLQWSLSPSGPDAKGLTSLFESTSRKPCNQPSLSAQICREVWLEIARGRRRGQNPKCTQKDLRGTVVTDIIDHLGDAPWCANQTLVSYSGSGSKRDALPLRWDDTVTLRSSHLVWISTLVMPNIIWNVSVFFDNLWCMWRRIHNYVLTQAWQCLFRKVYCSNVNSSSFDQISHKRQLFQFPNSCLFFPLPAFVIQSTEAICSGLNSGIYKETKLYNKYFDGLIERLSVPVHTDPVTFDFKEKKDEDQFWEMQPHPTNFGYISTLLHFRRRLHPHRLMIITLLSEITFSLHSESRFLLLLMS